MNGFKVKLFGWMFDSLFHINIDDFITHEGVFTDRRTQAVLTGVLGCAVSLAPYRTLQLSILQLINRLAVPQNNPNGNASVAITALEDGLHYFRVILNEICDSESLGNLSSKTAILETDFKRQAVYVCCRAENYELASDVYKRLFQDEEDSSRKPYEKKVQTEIKSVLDRCKSNDPIVNRSRYQDFLDNILAFIRGVVDESIPKPFLLKAYKEKMDQNDMIDENESDSQHLLSCTFDSMDNSVELSEFILNGHIHSSPCVVPNDSELPQLKEIVKYLHAQNGPLYSTTVRHISRKSKKSDASISLDEIYRKSRRHLQDLEVYDTLRVHLRDTAVMRPGRDIEPSIGFRECNKKNPVGKPDLEACRTEDFPIMLAEEPSSNQASQHEPSIKNSHEKLPIKKSPPKLVVANSEKQPRVEVSEETSTEVIRDTPTKSRNRRTPAKYIPDESSSKKSPVMSRSKETSEKSRCKKISEKSPTNNSQEASERKNARMASSTPAVQEGSASNSRTRKFPIQTSCRESPEKSNKAATSSLSKKTKLMSLRQCRVLCTKLELDDSIPESVRSSLSPNSSINLSPLAKKTPDLASSNSGKPRSKKARLSLSENSLDDSNLVKEFNVKTPSSKLPKLTKELCNIKYRRSLTYSPQREMDWLRKQPLVPPRRRGPGAKGLRWTIKEEDLLYRGISKYGTGKWALIKSDFDFPGRTTIDLSDKWRNIQKNKNLLNEIRRRYREHTKKK